MAPPEDVVNIRGTVARKALQALLVAQEGFARVPNVAIPEEIGTFLPFFSIAKTMSATIWTFFATIQLHSATNSG